MNPLPWWVKTLMLAALMAGSYWWGSSVQRTECELAAASRDVESYGAQVVMQARIGSADRALAEKQAAFLRGVAVETIKYKVVYRDRIQDPAVARCVTDSGLLELYRAAHGFAVSGDRPADTKGASTRPGQ